MSHWLLRGAFLYSSLQSFLAQMPFINLPRCFVRVLDAGNQGIPYGFSGCPLR